MLSKMVSTGFRLYTLPARMAYRTTASMFGFPGSFDQFLAEVRVNSEQVAREIQQMFEQVDREMSQKTAHLSTREREQAADLALHSAEQHLSMAAVNVLRAVWLATSVKRPLGRDADATIIDHEP